jgi:hypothetical protein
VQADWPTTAARGHALAMIESELQEYFDKCDHDDDGRIQYEEFLRLLDYLHARSSNPDRERSCFEGWITTMTDSSTSSNSSPDGWSESCLIDLRRIRISTDRPIGGCSSEFIWPPSLAA